MDNQLGNIERKLIVLTLEDAINSLEIAKRMCVNDTCDLDYDENISKEQLVESYKKLQSLLHELQNEIFTSGTFICIQNFVSAAQRNQSSLTKLQIADEHTRAELEASENQLTDENYRHHWENLQGSSHLGILKDQLQDEQWQQAVKLKYLSKYLAAQQNQHAIKLQMKEQQVRNIIYETQLAIEREHLVHVELESFYSMQLGDYIQQLVYWVDKYEQDMKMLDEKIAAKKNLHAEMREKIANAKKLYAEREAEIKAYEELKEKRRLEKERLDFLHSQATKIQAWWKGMMVRCKLGPYKVKKPKKGNKKSNKK